MKTKWPINNLKCESTLKLVAKCGNYIKRLLSAISKSELRLPQHTHSTQSSLAQPAPTPFACRHRLPRFPSLHQPWHTLRQGRVTSSCHRWAGSCGCTWAWASQVDSSGDEASSNIMKYKILFFFKESIWITYIYIIEITNIYKQYVANILRYYNEDKWYSDTGEDLKFNRTIWITDGSVDNNPPEGHKKWPHFCGVDRWSMTFI